MLEKLKGNTPYKSTEHSSPCSTALHVLQNAYKCITNRHPLLIKKIAIGHICLLVCLDFQWGKVPLNSIPFMKKIRGERKTQLLKSKVCHFRDLLDQKLRNPNPVMHLPVTGKICLQYGDVFAFNINLIRFVSSAVGQTDRMTYFPHFAKPVNV